MSVPINSNSLLPGLRQIIEPIHGASQVGLMVRNSNANAGDVRDTGLISVSEDPLEKGMATHSSVLTWRIPWVEEHGRLQAIGSQRIRHN